MLFFHIILSNCDKKITIKTHLDKLFLTCYFVNVSKHTCMYVNELMSFRSVFSFNHISINHTGVESINHVRIELVDVSLFILAGRPKPIIVSQSKLV